MDELEVLRMLASARAYLISRSWNKMSRDEAVALEDAIRELRTTIMINVMLLVPYERYFNEFNK